MTYNQYVHYRINKMINEYVEQLMIYMYKKKDISFT